MDHTRKNQAGGGKDKMPLNASRRSMRQSKPSLKKAEALNAKANAQAKVAEKSAAKAAAAANNNNLAAAFGGISLNAKAANKAAANAKQAAKVAVVAASNAKAAAKKRAIPSMSNLLTNMNRLKLNK